MAQVTAADIRHRLDLWKRGELPSDAIEQWARAAARRQQPESEAVGAVLARLETMARIDVSREDVQAIEEALGAADCGERLQRHFAGRHPIELPDGRVARSLSTDPLLKARAKSLREQALRRHRRGNVVAALVVVGTLILAAYLQHRGGYVESGAGIALGLTLGIVAFYLAMWLFERVVAAPRCAFCKAEWDTLFDGDALRNIRDGRCPACRSLL